MDQDMTDSDSLPDNNQGSRDKGWKFFFVRLSYMLVLSIGFVYTMSRFSGQGILDSLRILPFVFTLPILFIIGFALAMWKFWYSVPWFILATVIVNLLIFGFRSAEVLGLSVFEVPIFLVFTLFVFSIEKLFSRIPQKWLRITLAILPFVIMLFTILLTYFR